MKILIATPVSNKFFREAKGYFECIKGLKNRKYKIKIGFATENRKIIPLLNKYSKKYKIPIKTIYFKDNHNKMKNISMSRELLRKYFLSANFDYFFSLDSDIIMNEKTLENMLNAAKKFDIVINAYPEANKNFRSLVVSGLGCTIINKKTLKKVKFEISTNPEEITFFQQVFKNKLKYITGIFGPTKHRNLIVKRNSLNFLEKVKFKIFVITCNLRIAKLYHFFICKFKIRELLKL